MHVRRDGIAPNRLAVTPAPWRCRAVPRDCRADEHVAVSQSVSQCLGVNVVRAVVDFHLLLSKPSRRNTQVMRSWTALIALLVSGATAHALSDAERASYRDATRTVGYFFSHHLTDAAGLQTRLRQLHGPRVSSRRGPSAVMHANVALHGGQERYRDHGHCRQLLLDARRRPAVPPRPLSRSVRRRSGARGHLRQLRPGRQGPSV